MNNLDQIWYRQPAQTWQQALPLGNGRMGAMVFGGAACERVDLSESTFVSGEASQQNNRPGAPQAYRAAREALLRREYARGNELAEGMTGLRLNFGTNLPVGRLLLDFIGLEPVAEYTRSLDIAQAVSRVQFTEGCRHHGRESFQSHPDAVMVIRITGGAAFRVRFESGCPAETGFAGADLVSTVRALESTHSDGQTGVTLHLRVRVLAAGGAVRTLPDETVLQVEPVNEAILLLAMNTDFACGDPFEQTRTQLEAAAAQGYDQLLQRHIADVMAFSGRCGLRMGKASALPTDEWLAQNRTQADDGALAALMFRYGRYLLFCSSREDSPLPAHLQGGWNDGIACRIGWSCDMHLDINTQMNYWPAHVTGLQECALPLHRWVEHTLMPSGERTARETYGLDGWAAHTVSNAWGYSAPGQSIYWGMHVTGGVWIATHLWQHWLYTGDREFLRDEALPVIRGAAVFFAEYLVRDPVTGFMLPVPSDSPENSFLCEGYGLPLSEGAYCDVIMIRELFAIYEALCAELGIADDLQQRAAELAEDLPGFRIGRHGQLQEWLQDFEEASPNHRHTCHMLSLFPFAQITPEKTPALAAAARQSILRRMHAEEPWEDTGWARSLLLLYSARLWAGDEAGEHVRSMLRTLTNDNLLVFHPPVAGADSNVYELDGNTGLTAGIAEMLLQSHDGVIRLLPALPALWQDGQATGLRARGGFAVDMRWQQGALVEAAVTSAFGGLCRLRYGTQLMEIELNAGERRSIAF